MNKFPSRVVLIFGILLAASAALAGCQGFITAFSSPNDTPTEYIAGQWSSMMRDLGLVPVYPPHEDIRVGDLFVYGRDPDGKTGSLLSGQTAGQVIRNPRWSELPVQEELEEVYQGRASWPPTPDAYLQVSSDPDSRTWPEPELDEDRSIFAAEETPKRLRIVGLDQFTATKFTEGDLNKLIPTEAVNLVLGTAWMDWKAVTVRPHGAEAYSLPLENVISLVVEERDLPDTEVEPTEAALGEEGSEEASSGEAGVENVESEEDQPAERERGAIKPAVGPARYVLKEPYRKHLAFVSDPGSKTVWIRVVTEVLYIRGIDVTIQTQERFDGDDELAPSELNDPDEEALPPAAVVEPQETIPGQEEPYENPQVYGTPQPYEPIFYASSTEEEKPLDPIYGAFVRARAINEVLIETDSDDLPGQFVRFISVTDDSVAIRRIWRRVMAIGVRGLTLEVNKDTGEVLRSNLMR